MMLGEQVGLQDRLFYEFDIEDRIPNDHLLRRIDAVLDLNWLRTELSPFYSHTGRPSVDPELKIRMLRVSAIAIRSARNAGCVGMLNLIWLIDGSAVSGLRMRFPIIRLSPSTGMDASATAIFCVPCSRAWCTDA